MSKLDLELVVILVSCFLVSVGLACRLCVRIRCIRRGITETQLVDKIWIIQKVVKTENAALSLLLYNLLVRNDISGVDFGDDIDTVVDVSHSVSGSTDLTSFRLRIED